MYQAEEEDFFVVAKSGFHISGCPLLDGSTLSRYRRSGAQLFNQLAGSVRIVPFASTRIAYFLEGLVIQKARCIFWQFQLTLLDLLPKLPA